MTNTNPQKEQEYRKTIKTACISLGDLLREDRKRIEEATKCYNMAIEVSEDASDKADALHAMGLTHRIYKKEPDKAIGYYEKATELRDSGWSWCDLGNCYLEKKKPEPDKALDCFKKASKIEENYPFSWHISSAIHCMGHTYWKFKWEYDRAIDCYKKAIELCEDLKYWHYKWSWWEMGQCYLQKEMYEKAIEASDKAIEVDSDNPIFWHTKAYSLWKLKKYEEAIECYQKSINLNPKYYVTWLEMGICYLKKEKPDPEKALERFKEAVNLDINCYPALRNIAEIYWKFKRDYEKAMEYCQKAQKAGDPEASKYIEKIEEEISEIKDVFKYDVALSFAEEDREIAEKLANALREKGIKVFYDEFYKSDLFGKNLTDYFQEIYGEGVRFVIPLISKYYRIKDGSNFEFSIAMEEAKKRRTEFILPVRLDDTKILGLPYYIGYLDFNKERIDVIVKCISEKLKKDEISTKKIEYPEYAERLKDIYPEKVAARLANSFRIAQDIRNNYCNIDTTEKRINKEFDLLKMYLTEKEFLDEVENIQRKINAELREDERLDEKHVEEVKDFCEKFTEMWIARFLK
jgi:tetratricopeptide (TPR) repeat protein